MSSKSQAKRVLQQIERCSFAVCAATRKIGSLDIHDESIFLYALSN
ncbi:MAG: hypothetical protein JO208_05015 [Alphaproteobacteria bacterium]|nr:hypothetical protein [Alphaproteobacteria bacterium]